MLIPHRGGYDAPPTGAVHGPRNGATTERNIAGIVDDLGDGFGIFGAVVDLEDLDREPGFG
jgi:hypothetical protein